MDTQPSNPPPLISSDLSDADFAKDYEAKTARALQLLREAGFTMRNLKTWRGMEGTGWQAVLLLKDKALGDLTNEGRGGCLRHPRFDAATMVILSAISVQVYGSPVIGENLDGAFEDMSIQLETENKLRRACKTKTCFREKQDGVWAEYFVLPVPFSPEVKARLVAKHAGKTLEFANELFTKTRR